MPVVGTLLGAPGPFALALPPTGTYHLQAASLAADDDPREWLLPGRTLRVGARREPVRVRDGKVDGPTDVPLRTIGPDEPQTLLELPSLLPRWLDVAHRGHRSGA